MKRIAMFLATAALIIGVSGFTGCSTNLPKVETSREGVAAAYAAFGIAGTGVASYVHSPECTSPVTQLPCSNATVVARLKPAAENALKAIQAADQTVYSPGWDGSGADKLLAAAKTALLYLTAITAESVFVQTAPTASKDVAARANKQIDKIPAQ